MVKPEGKEGVEVRRRCPACRGEGVVERPLQEIQSGHLFTEAFSWQGEEALMEEGQLLVPDLVEIVDCPACAGRGRVTVWLTGSEYRALRRRRLLRGAVLLVAGLIPFLLLLGAILANPEAICGRPWYGAGLLLLLAFAGRNRHVADG